AQVLVIKRTIWCCHTLIASRLHGWDRGVSKVSEDDLPAGAGKRGVKPSGKPTLKTIAQMTGFAVTTISRALNNAPELSQDTRDRVQKVAAEVGYLPDRAALRLKTGRTNVI